MNSLVAVRGVRAALNNGGLSWRSTYATQTNVCNQQKKGSSTPSGSGTPPSKPVAPSTPSIGKNYDPPSNVFKKVDSKSLGPGAGKDTNYKNPEYFSYHEMSYAEMEIVMAKYRIPQPSAIKH